MASKYISYNLGIPGANSKSPFEIGETAGWKSWVGYFLAILIVLFIILIFVHYFITPIFKFRAGGPGFIPVPAAFDDGKLYWTKDATAIPDTSTPLRSKTENYTILLDIFVENPMQFANQPRVIFYRGSVANQTPTTNTLYGLLSNYNVAVALAPDTNDLIVSVLNTDNNMENILLPNVPVQQAFRLGMVVMDHALEVYVNGRLAKTRAFDKAPKAVTGNLWPPTGTVASAVRVYNLHIWPRPLTPGEIRSSGPTLAAKPYTASPIPASSSSTCQDSGVSGMVSNAIKSI
jgi:hypothetical protein